MIGTNLQLAVIEDGQIRLLDDIIDDVISIALARYDGSPTLAAAKHGMGGQRSIDALRGAVGVARLSRIYGRLNSHWTTNSLMIVFAVCNSLRWQ